MSTRNQKWSSFESGSTKHQLKLGSRARNLSRARGTQLGGTLKEVAEESKQDQDEDIDMKEKDFEDYVREEDFEHILGALSHKSIRHQALQTTKEIKDRVEDQVQLQREFSKIVNNKILRVEARTKPGLSGGAKQKKVDPALERKISRSRALLNTL